MILAAIVWLVLLPLMGWIVWFVGRPKGLVRQPDPTPPPLKPVRDALRHGDPEITALVANRAARQMGGAVRDLYHEGQPDARHHHTTR